MKVTKLGWPQPIINSGTGLNAGGRVPSGGADLLVLTSNGSNGRYWGENVRRITSNGSNTLLSPDVNFASGSNITFSVSSNTLTIHSTGSGTNLRWFVVTDYGAVGDGVTNDTAGIQATIDAAEAAGGGVVYFPKRLYVVSGALQDTARSNAQILLPRRQAYSAAEQITVHLLGEVAPPSVPSVVGAMVLPDNGPVIKSTLAAGTGNVIGAWGPAGSFEDFSNVRVVVENLTIRTVANPTNTGLDLSHVAAAEVRNVAVDAANYDVASLALQTTATSYGLKLPAVNNGAATQLDLVNVVGFYNGILAGEHTVGDNVAVWGARQAVVFPFGYHASHFGRLGTYHCIRGLVFTGSHYVSVDQFNVEHAASGTWVTVYDIDDATSQGHGHLAWHAVLAGTGVHSVFTVNGATDIHRVELGDNPFAGTPSGPAGGDLSGTYPNPSVVDDSHSHTTSTLPATKELLIRDTPSTPLVFADLIQNEAQTDLVYGD